MGGGGEEGGGEGGEVGGGGHRKHTHGHEQVWLGRVDSHFNRIFSEKKLSFSYTFNSIIPLNVCLLLNVWTLHSTYDKT